MLLSLIGFCCALALLYAGWRLARPGGWVFQWMRGTAMMMMVVVAGVLVALSLELLQYDSTDTRAPIASIGVKSVDDESYLLELTFSDGKQWYTSLEGDAWQIDAKLMRFTGLSALLNSGPLAELHAVSTRYYAYEEREQARSIGIAPSSIDEIFLALSADSWQILQRLAAPLGVLGVHLETRVSPVVGLTDGALYKLRWSGEELSLQAANEVAQASL